MELALGTVTVDLTVKRNTTLLAVVQLRRENILLRSKNLLLKEEAAQAFNDTKEAVNEVIDTSKSWKAFEMLTKPYDIPRYERCLDF